MTQEALPAPGDASAFTVLIPARLASTRLPNKPLADIAGLPMVVRVARRAQQSKAQQVVVAADDALIVQACLQHGVQVVLTDKNHASGSDRLAQACTHLGLQGDDIVVNVQGDEPLMDPALIDQVAALLPAHPDASMGTAAHPIASQADYLNPNVVKVVLDARNMAHYFSRAPIPWSRDQSAKAWWEAQTASLPGSEGGRASAPFSPLRHVGIYSYRAGFLTQFPHLSPAPTEAIEALEQLRALWHGHRIAVHIAQAAPGPGVDTPEDLNKVRAILASSGTPH